MYTKQEIIIQTYRQGKSQREISRNLGVSRKTVRKYIDDYEKHLDSSEDKKQAQSDILKESSVSDLLTPYCSYQSFLKFLRKQKMRYI